MSDWILVWKPRLRKRWLFSEFCYARELCYSFLNQEFYDATTLLSFLGIGCCVAGVPQNVRKILVLNDAKTGIVLRPRKWFEAKTLTAGTSKHLHTLRYTRMDVLAMQTFQKRVMSDSNVACNTYNKYSRYILYIKSTPLVPLFIQLYVSTH